MPQPCGLMRLGVFILLTQSWRSSNFLLSLPVHSHKDDARDFWTLGPVVLAKVLYVALVRMRMYLCVSVWAVDLVLTLRVEGPDYKTSEWMKPRRLTWNTTETTAERLVAWMGCWVYLASGFVRPFFKAWRIVFEVEKLQTIGGEGLHLHLDLTAEGFVTLTSGKLVCQWACTSGLLPAA